MILSAKLSEMKRKYKFEGVFAGFGLDPVTRTADAEEQFVRMTSKK